MTRRSSLGRLIERELREQRATGNIRQDPNVIALLKLAAGALDDAAKILELRHGERETEPELVLALFDDVHDLIGPAAF